ncbi:hypothetical protein ABN763_11960 [Spongiivirga sp. MCCC 1A20706]|uniref:hypothetical protein n=1 Tax=Spongiivirga sp. MCCC 1A20706 TaxID=3160963 RepID=UPI003977DF48
MKFNGLHWLGITTLLLITVTIFVSMKLSFGLIFYITVLGQLLLIYAVYKVLTDNYTTDKTFEDFYEDRPDLGK